MESITITGFFWSLGAILFLIILFSFLYYLIKAVVAPGKSGSWLLGLVVYLFFVLPAKVFMSAGPFRFALIPVYFFTAACFFYAGIMLVINILKIG